MGAGPQTSQWTRSSGLVVLVIDSQKGNLWDFDKFHAVHIAFLNWWVIGNPFLFIKFFKTQKWGFPSRLYQIIEVVF